jgi:hypothetical protein
MFCNGANELVLYIKQSDKIKERYKENLGANGQIRLRTDKQIIKGIPFEILLDESDQTKLDTSDLKELKTDCKITDDKNPDFDLMFYFAPDRKILIASIATILDRPGYRSGYHFATKLNDKGELGQVKITEFSE